MDDFSFPAIAMEPDPLCQLPFPHFAASPLWFLSEPKAASQRRSFSSAEDAYAGLHTDQGAHPSSPALSDGARSGRPLENEKMDLLWEDFNEELARLSHHKRQASERPAGAGPVSKPSKGNGGATPSRGMTKSNSVVQHRRPSLVVMVRLFKRLFSTQNPRSSRKTRHCDEEQDDAPRV